MSATSVIWIVIAWFAVFLALGQNVATVLFGAGIVGIALYIGIGPLGGIIGPDTFYSASIYSLSIVPLYLLMAQMLLRGGIINDLFQVGHRMSGYRRYPLGVATIVTGSLLGAVSGSGAASSASLAAVASPELEELGYTRRFSLSIAAVAGSLSAIVPPSLIMIIYGSLTSVPIGHLFIGALGPALLCITIYVVCLKVFGEIRKDAQVDGTIPDEPEERDGRRRSRNAFLFVVTLMVVVFGGIYGGIITVAEAGAIGAFTAMVGMVAMGRVSRKDIFQALAESVKITAALMMLVLGAKIFARFLTFSRLPNELIAVMDPLMSNPGLVAVILLAVFFLAGMFLESAAVIVLLVPIILPLLEAAGIDLLWFGVSASTMIALGLLTPPVGLASFAAASAAGHPASQVFRGATIFALAAGIIVTGMLLVFPSIVTWLPAQMR
ncbi:TRAP transporter large permease [Marinobacter sp. OP 3.4]|uniref:TRAP transporter large permease n=1 Tax=Marinobacter sp. OP 3.4 TaxID=3076501 RepID=UPI002E1EFB7F